MNFISNCYQLVRPLAANPSGDNAPSILALLGNITTRIGIIIWATHQTLIQNAYKIIFKKLLGFDPCIPPHIELTVYLPAYHITPK